MNVHLGRKVGLFILSLTIITIALFTKFLTGDQFINGMSICFGMFVAGNVGEHFAKKN